MTERKMCTKCKKILRLYNYYTYKNGETCDICKKCMVLKVDVSKPETFLPIFEELDVPYIEREWETLRDCIYEKYVDDSTDQKREKIIGRYLAKMRFLRSFKFLTFADSDALNKKRSEIDNASTENM